MSFSHEVKEALASIQGENPEERRRELQALYRMVGGPDGDGRLLFSTENILVAKKIIILLHEFFPGRYSFRVQYKGRFRKVFYLVSLLTRDEAFFEPGEILRRKEQAAFLRASFLARGSLTDPRKGYHLELRCPNFAVYILLRDLLTSFDVDAKGITRKDIFFLYLKDGEMISDFLKILGAYSFMFAFEETRVIKEMKNKANRINNCDLANLDKTIEASGRQSRIIREIGLENLPEALREVARLRLEHPELPLGELGELCMPPLKKAAVHYRLRKIEAMWEGGIR